MDLIQYINLGAVGVILVLFVTGRIVSVAELDRVRKDRDQTVAAAEKRAEAAERREQLWQQAHDAVQERNRFLDAQVEELLRRDQFMVEVWKALRQIAEQGRP